MSLTMWSLTQHYISFSFIRLSPSFRIWIFSSHVVAYIVSFDSGSWTRKSNILRPRYQLFNACGGWCPSPRCLSHYLTFSFIPLTLSFGIWIFSFHIIAYIISFDSKSWTRKSNIIRPCYELFNACGGSCPSLPCLWHYLTFSFISLTSSFGIWILSSHVVANIVSFDSRSWTRKSDIIRPGYELFNACGGSCPSLPYPWHKITLPFHSFLVAWVSKFGFFHPIS